MPGFTVTETFTQPVEDVWNVLIDIENAPKWMNGIDSMTLQGGLVEGAVIKFHSRGAERESRISKLVPQSCLALTSTQGPVTATYTYSLRNHGDHTLMTLQAVCEGRGLIKILMPFMSWLLKYTDGNHLSELKRILSD